MIQSIYLIILPLHCVFCAIEFDFIDINDNAPAFFSKIFIDPPALDESTGVRELLKSGSSQPVSVEITTTEPIVVPETIEIGKYIARGLNDNK